jgi:hypothetical protein
MKALFWIGLIVLTLGLISLVVPIPQNDRKGIEAGGISIGIETQSKETVPPVASAATILVGAGMTIAGRSKR